MIGATTICGCFESISPTQRASNIVDYESISPPLGATKNCGCATQKNVTRKIFTNGVHQKKPLTPPPPRTIFQKVVGFRYPPPPVPNISLFALCR